MPTPPQPGLAGVVVLLQQLNAALQGMKGGQAGGAPSPISVAPADISQLVSLLQVIQGQSGAGLGPVNGALGQTIGNLLNGKKSAIGIAGATTTAILHNADALTGSAALAPLTNALGLVGGSGTFLPLFLAMTAWGFLGKMEKWSQPGATPPS